MSRHERYYLDMDACMQRYPRLLHAMRWVACLSRTEAAACLRDFRLGMQWSGEAVNHFGGCRVVIQRAIATRQHSRASFIR